MKKILIIIGASGHGKVIADIAMRVSLWSEVFFLDDDESIKKCLGFDVVGKTTDAVKYKSSAEFIVAIGDNLVRERLQVSLEKMNFTLTKLIHPTAIIGTDVAIGDGTVVAAGVVINSSSRIGKGCIINTHSSLDHDNCLGDFVHISPGACLTGTVNIGSRCWIGSGVVINNNLSICEDCIIGSGGVVVSDITLPGTYIGVPVMRIHC